MTGPDGSPLVADTAHADARFMRVALALAERGLYSTTPNPRVGCVLVRAGAIIGQGWHERAGSAHAEVNAIRDAGSETRGCTAYVTLEPCNHTGRTGPCTEALVEAGVTRVVAAMTDPDPRVGGSGLKRLEASGIEVATGVCEAEALALNVGFISRMRRGRPWLRVKLAMSLDGRTALASGESQWITGAESRADVQHWRARSCAILTGIGTILTDDPRLNVRAEELACVGQASGGDLAVLRQPALVIADSGLRTPDRGAWLGVDRPVFIAHAASATGDGAIALPARAQLLDCSPPDPGKREAKQAARRVDLDQLALALGRLEMNEVHVEAGARLGGALIEAGLADELLVYIGASLLGHDAKPLVQLPALSRLTDRYTLAFDDVRLFGSDCRILARLTGAKDAGFVLRSA